MTGWARQRLPMVWALLFLIPGATGAEAKTRRGFVFAHLSPTSFQLDDGTVVHTGIPATTTNLVVGSEVSVSGDYDPERKLLVARQLRVQPAPSGRVGGRAVLEFPPEAVPEGVVLTCDGRRLLLTQGTRFVGREPAEKPVARADFLARLEPGDYLDYEGNFLASGEVRVTRMQFWENTPDASEAELRARYQPRFEPAQGPRAPDRLWVGKATYRLYLDPVVQDYVERVGMRLAASLWHRGERDSFAGLHYGFFVAESEPLGAAGYPSGVVVIRSSLLQLVENEAQLAFLLGHELAHATQGHFWRSRRHHRRKLLVLRWSTLHLGRVVEEAIRKGYERDLEEQADRLALAYMVRAGYDPRQGYRFLQRLEAAWPAGLSPLLWGSHRSFGHRRRALMVVLQTTFRQLDFGLLLLGEETMAAIRLRLPELRIKSASPQGGRER